VALWRVRRLLAVLAREGGKWLSREGLVGGGSRRQGLAPRQPRGARSCDGGPHSLPFPPVPPCTLSPLPPPLARGEHPVHPASRRVPGAHLRSGLPHSKGHGAAALLALSRRASWRTDGIPESSAPSRAMCCICKCWICCCWRRRRALLIPRPPPAASRAASCSAGSRLAGVWAFCLLQVPSSQPRPGLPWGRGRRGYQRRHCRGKVWDGGGRRGGLWWGRGGRREGMVRWKRMG